MYIARAARVWSKPVDRLWALSAVVSHCRGEAFGRQIPTSQDRFPSRMQRRAPARISPYQPTVFDHTPQYFSVREKGERSAGVGRTRRCLHSSAHFPLPTPHFSPHSSLPTPHSPPEEFHGIPRSIASPPHPPILPAMEGSLGIQNRGASAKAQLQTAPVPTGFCHYTIYSSQKHILYFFNTLDIYMLCFCQRPLKKDIAFLKKVNIL